MLDSTEWEKMEAGLQLAGGKCILNSTNYEDGAPRFVKVLELAQEYGAGVVIGTIDEEGMARDADKKFEIARRAYEQATGELGFPAHDIFFDPLALPVSTGIEEDRRNALETIEVLRRIKAELPGCFTLLGVSNVSFGLNPAARVVLNSVFLHDAVEAGLDAAIVNASKIVPLNRVGEREVEVARDLIYDRRRFDGEICTYDPLAEFTTLFEGVTAKSMKPDVSALPVEERLKRHIIDGARKLHGARHHQRHSARRHEDRRRAVRQRPDAAPLRAAIGRGDEGRGSLPRALHGEEGRGDDEGDDGARDR
jgi:5-methyltetrahydrofolate--homocysteine methyltransferase